MKLTRGLIAISAVGVCITALAGCANQDVSHNDSIESVNTSAPLYDALPQDIKEAGRIVNAGDLTFAPFESLDADGKTVVGVDVDIANALSEQLGVPFTWENVKTEAALSGLQTGRYDTLLSSMTYTDKRAETYDYVTYLKATSLFLTSPDRVGEFKDKFSFCGTKVAGARGTLQVTLVEELSKECIAKGKAAIQVLALDTDQAGILQIKQGGADASIINGAVGTYAASLNPQSVAIVPNISLGNSVYGIMLNKSDTKLRDALHKAMNKLIEDGTYSNILKKWNMEGIAISESLINNKP